MRNSSDRQKNRGSRRKHEGKAERDEYRSPGKKDLGTGRGAGRPLNTLLNTCGIRADLVDFVVDVNPLKQGRYLPGTRLPIRHPDEIAKAKPDYLLILPWNLREEIMQQTAFARAWGCRFVTPIPEVQVFD